MSTYNATASDVMYGSLDSLKCGVGPSVESNAMKSIALTMATLLSMSCVAASQAPERFPLLITKVKRVNEGCTAEASYREVRHQVFAHKEATEEPEITALFSKGTNRELQRLIASLATLHEALWNLFINERKLVLRRARFSVAGIRRRPKPKFFSNRAVQEAITHETQEFLIFAAGTPGREALKERR